MPFSLNDVAEWPDDLSCTPTALCAVTGKGPQEITLLLQSAARMHGREISAEARDDYAVSDWLAVVERLGGAWFKADDFSERDFSQRPTIEEWMQQQLVGAQLELVMCDDGASVGHVFATLEGDVVDTYTGGKRVKFSRVPPDFGRLRVKYTFVVE